MALFGALATGAANLIGGLFGAGSAKKAANQQMQLQDRLNENDARRQLGLLQSQNYETWRTNQDIKEYNRDVLDNHSTNTLNEKRHEITSTTGSIDFKKLVADAEAAGFNPLTVLRAGAAAGYSTQNTQFYSDFASSGRVARDIMTYLAPPDVPVMGYNGQVQTIQPSNPIGDAINAGMNYYMNYDPTKNQRRELEMGLTKAQIENLQSETRRNNNLGLLSGMGFTGGDRGTRGGFSGMVSSMMGMHPQADLPEVGTRSATNNYPVNSGMLVNPNVPDYEMTETRLGENPFTWPFSLYIQASDIDYTLQQKGVHPPQQLQSGPNAAGQKVGGWLGQQYNALKQSWNDSSSLSDFANQNLLQRNNSADNFPFRFETTR